MVIKKQAGMSLIELMIGMLVGLFIVGGVVSVYIAVAASSGDTLKLSRLNQEMSAIMNVMSNDIRRAGYWSDAAGSQPQENPFAQYDTTANDDSTALEVRDASANVFISDTASGTCIIYSYDTDEDDSLDTDDRLGFRWQGAGNALEMRTGGTTADSCADADGTWVAVNNTNSITVTGLTFNLANSTCINSSEPDSEEDGGDAGVVDDDIEYDCYTVTPDADAATTEIREVTITLQAELATDSLVTASMTQTVRVRNDLVRIR